MKSDESTPIAAKMSTDDIKQFQERKAWYEECKQKKIRCTIEDIGFEEETKHEIWLTFLYSPLRRYIVDGKVVIRPDDVQRTVILLNKFREKYPDQMDEEYCHMLLELVKTGVANLYIPTDKMTDIDSNTDYPDKNGDSIHNVLHNCVISGNENSLSVGGNLNMGSSNVGGYKANHGGLM